MGLTDAISRTASRHAHALVVEVPGWWCTRTAAERAVAARGWRLAASAADADVLVVCGEPGPRLAEAVEVVWNQMPGPRVRVEVHGYDEVGVRLDEAHSRLLDTKHHRHDAQQRPTAADLVAEQGGEGVEGHDGHGDADEAGGADHGQMGHEQMDHGGHEGMDHEQMDHGGHEGHGDMDMSPGGIPLAEGGEDRDGLEMDVLKVRLGPVLPHWPAGLVLHCSLQGDVIVEAQAELVDGSAHVEDEVPGTARSMDNISALLALAGWDDAAAEARRIRDIVLTGGAATVGPKLERLRRKVRRSWTLRWSLRGLRRLSEGDIHQLGLPVEATGDTYDRLVGTLDRAGGADGRASAFSTDHLADLVTGLDLATTRLVVASLDIGELRAGRADHEVAHD